MKKNVLFAAGLLMISMINAQTTNEINWWKSQKIFVGGSVGFGGSEKIDLHMEHTTSINGMPSGGPEPTMMNSGLFAFSGDISYYPTKIFSLHLKAGQQSHKIDEIKDQGGKSFMYAAVLQAKINIIHNEKIPGSIYNVYLGGGYGAYSFKFWRQETSTRTDVSYEGSSGPDIVVGAEFMTYDKENLKWSYMFYFDLTYDVAGFDFKSAKENSQVITPNNLAFNDWKHINGNAFSAEVGLRFSIFNKKLPLKLK